MHIQKIVYVISRPSWIWTFSKTDEKHLKVEMSYNLIV